jgi:hypothetical protein
MMFRKVYQLVVPSVARGLALVLVNALSYSRLVLFTPSYVTSKNDNINKWYRDIMYTKPDAHAKFQSCQDALASHCR